MIGKPSPPMLFLQVCRMFHADIADTCPTFASMADFSLQHIEGVDCDALAQYLDRLLSGEYTEDELMELWNGSGADVFIPDVKNLLALLTEMRRQLRAVPE